MSTLTVKIKIIFLSILLFVSSARAQEDPYYEDDPYEETEPYDSGAPAPIPVTIVNTTTTTPPFPNLVSAKDFMGEAMNVWGSMQRAYFDSGATVYSGNNEDNAIAFKRRTLKGSVLKNVQNIQYNTTVFGKSICFTCSVALMELQQLAHPDGEVGSALAACSFPTVFICPTFATMSLEEVAAKAPEPKCTNWMQTYFFKDRSITANIVYRAWKAKYSAIVITMGVPMIGKGRSTRKTNFHLPDHLSLANFDYTTRQLLQGEVVGQSALTRLNQLLDPSAKWEDLVWLKSVAYGLPVVVHGIQTAADAERAIYAGANGIIVASTSEYSAATLDVLADIVAQVKGRIPVFMEGGIRDGTDIIKAHAIGAKLVFSNIAISGLGVGGQAGATRSMDILFNEMNNAMKQIGVSTIDGITEANVGFSRTLCPNYS